MVKLSGSRKKFILKAFAVLVVCAFLVTSLGPSIGHSGTGANTKPIYGVNSNPLVSGNNNFSDLGYIKYAQASSENTYKVVFTESGLLSNNNLGTVPWSVTMDGETLWSTNSTITFNVPNGTYHYHVSKTASAAGYTPSLESGNITVNGNTKSVLISYNTYKVVFIESGLLSHHYLSTSVYAGVQIVVPWSVTMDGETLWSTTSTITFNVPNGTYHYQVSKTASAAGYTPSPESGNITVNGNAISVLITYSPNGNPRGSGNGKYDVFLTPSITINDNYNYNMFILTNRYNKYTSDLINGMSTFSGVLNGTYLLYLVVVNVGVSGNFFASPVQSAGYSQISEPQVVVVNGSSLALVVNFSKLSVSVITSPNSVIDSNHLLEVFVLTNQYNTYTKDATSAITTFSGVLNGTYLLYLGIEDCYNSVLPIQSAGYSQIPEPQVVVVNGSSVSVEANFSKIKPATYNITFSESGLPSGTSWSVTLNGTSESSTSSTITFTETNGTYSYTVSSVSGYSVFPSSGSITVSAKSFNQAVTFTPTTKSVSRYTVTFTETGLPSGTSWYVNLSNGMDSGPITGSSYSFQLTNGTYSYTTSNVSGYSVSPSSGSISINGASVSKTVSFTPIKKSPPSSGISSTELYGIIGAVAVVAVIGSVFAIMRRRR